MPVPAALTEPSSPGLPWACALFLAGSLVACSGQAPTSDANGDAGFSASDAGVSSPGDVSNPPPDAAIPRDAAPDGATGGDASKGGAQDAGHEAGAVQDAGVVEDAGPDDPGLSNPSRPSFPYECQGTPMTVSEAIEHFALAEDLIHVENATDWNGTGQIFDTGEVGRTCTAQTGCSGWGSGTSATGDPSFWLWLHVDGTGVVSLEQLDWQGAPILARIIPSGEFQMIMGGIDDGVNPKPPAIRYEVRIVRNADGTGCLSAASAVTTDPPRADGSTYEHFWLGVANLPARAAIPRPTPAPRTAWASACQGAPAEDNVIASWFSPGSSSLTFSNANATSRTSTQSCHPITGCTEWSYGTLPIWRLFGLQTAGSAGFALRIDNNVSVPISHGVPGATVSGSAYSGLVATSGCVSYDAKQLVTYSDSAVVGEDHVEEQNKAF
jgi:hypothetical protein